MNVCCRGNSQKKPKTNPMPFYQEQVPPLQITMEFLIKADRVILLVEATQVGRTMAGLLCEAEVPVDAEDPAKTAPKAVACIEGTPPKTALLDKLASNI